MRTKVKTRRAKINPNITMITPMDPNMKSPFTKILLTVVDIFIVINYSDRE